MMPMDQEAQDQSELRDDRDRLDWLQEQLNKKSYTGKCIFRLSTSGRGWRLHETSEEARDRFGIIPTPSVREAIDQAMERENEDSSSGVERDSEATDSGACAQEHSV